MEALLNQDYNDDNENSVDLELRIQKELDAYQLCDNNSPLNKTSHSVSFINKSFDVTELETWKELEKGKEIREKMCAKFEKNIKNLKEITSGFKKEEKTQDFPLEKQGFSKENPLEKEDLDLENHSIEDFEAKNTVFSNEDLTKEKLKKIQENASFSQEEKPRIFHENQQKPANSLNKFFTKSRKIINNFSAFPESEAEISQKNQEIEWFRMEKEDFLSHKLEIEVFRNCFSLRNHKFPLKNQIKPMFFFEEKKAVFFEDFSEKLFFVQKNSKIASRTLNKICEENLLPKNDKKRCFSNISMIINPKKRFPLNFSTKIPGNIVKKLEKSPLNFEVNFPVFSSDFLSIYLEKIEKIITNLLKIQKIAEILPIIHSQKKELAPFEPFSEADFANEELLFSENIEKSLFCFISQIPPEKQKKLEFLNYKDEKLTDLQGISSLSHLKYLILSMNKISKIEQFSNNLLIEINLSQNKIVDFSAFSSLKFLRVLNLEMNEITRISALKESSQLEFLNLNKNRIKKLENLEFNKKITKLLLYQNSIEKIENLQELTSLEILDLGRNQIKSLGGLNSCVSLRKLIVYNNKIEEIEEDLELLLLIELFLNNNRIKKIEKIRFFPCLEVLNLENNEIETFCENSLNFWPNLKVLKLDFNRIGSFWSVFAMISHRNINNLQIKSIGYQENLFTQEISKETLDFYEEILYRNCQKLEEINSKKRLSLCFDRKIEENPKKTGNLWIFSAISNEYQFIEGLDGKKFKKTWFSKEKAFFLKRNFLSFEHLSMISGYKESFLYKNNGFYHEKENYELEIRKKARKIQSLLIKNCFFLRKKRKILLKKMSFYEENLRKIVFLQKITRGFLVRSKGSFVKKPFYKEKAAVNIQKHVKGWLLRKKKAFLFGKIHYKDQEIDDLKEIDSEFFYNEKNYDFSLKLPEKIDFFEFMGENTQKTLYEEENSKILRENTEKIHKKEMNSVSNKKKLPPISNENLFQKVDNSFDSSEISSILSKRSSKMGILPKISEKDRKEEEKASKIMENWGLKNPELKKTLAFKLEKERKRKEENRKKVMSSEERLVKFLKNVKKK